jgi:hypothetical protein
MKSNRLDNIFQVKGGIPFLAGFYIGMDDEKVQERIENLCSGQIEQSSDNFLFKYSVSYEYELFQSEYLLKKIILIFSQECSTKDSDFLFDYFIKNFYHEKVHKEIESDSNGNLLKYRVDLSNYYYRCSFYNKDGKFFIQLEGIVAYPSLYKAFYLVGTDPGLKGFVHKSLSFSNYAANKDKILNDLFPVYNGLPTVCSVYLGLGVSSSSEAEGIIDDILHAPEKYYQHLDYRDISFEVMIGWNNQIDEIIMRMSEEDKDVALNIINHLKQRLMIENASYYVAEGIDGEFKILVNMSNAYLSVKAENPYCSQTNRRDIEISIKALKDGRDLYQSLYDMLCDNTHYGYFKAADVFYHYDSENNYSPVGAYDSYEEAIDAFQGD